MILLNERKRVLHYEPLGFILRNKLQRILRSEQREFFTMPRTGHFSYIPN